MENIIKFENTNVEFEKINGEWMAEIYSTGMALGYFTQAKGKIYPYKDRIMKTLKNADISPVSHGVKLFLNEKMLYDFMLEARTDKCRSFRKWLTNEVLPELNHTGSYSMSKAVNQPEDYEYFDKTYNGEPVLTSEDIARLTGLTKAMINWFLKTRLKKSVDYYLLDKAELISFKMENPKLNRILSRLNIITKSGFEKICKAYGIQVETPNLFIDENKQLKLEDKQDYRKVVVPSEAVKRLMGYLEREIKSIYRITQLMMSTDTEENLENYRKSLVSHMKNLKHFWLDVETVKIK